MRFLFVDRIIQSSPGESIKGVKHVTKDDACLTLDAQGRSFFIPSFIGETLGQLAAWNVMAHNGFTLRPVAGVVSSARLCRPAYVGETLLLESFIDVLDDTAVQYHSVARVGDEPVFIIDGALGPLLPMPQFISHDEITQQYNEIYRPGDWDAFCALSASSKSIEEIGIARHLPLSMTFDSLLSSTAGVSLVAKKSVTGAAPYFPDHFPKKPVLPMTVLLECKLNLARQFLEKAAYGVDYQVSELRKIKMNEFVQPGDVIICQVKVKQQTPEELILSFRSEVGGRRVCVVDVVLHSKGN